MKIDWVNPKTGFRLMIASAAVNGALGVVWWSQGKMFAIFVSGVLCVICLCLAKAWNEL